MNVNLDPLSTGFALAISVCAFGYWIDGKVDEDIRQRFRDLLQRRTKQEDLRIVVSSFISLFDRIFKRNRFGRPGIFRSMLASGLILSSAVCIWYVIAPKQAMSAFDQSSHINFPITIVVVISVNFLGDFLSLWQSRYVVGVMSRATTFLGVLGFLALDLLVSIVIFSLAMLVAFFLWFYSNLIFSEAGAMTSVFTNLDVSMFVLTQATTLWEAWGKVIHGFFADGIIIFSGSHVGDLLAICFYSTLFTSIWVWAYVLGYAVWPLFNGMRRILNVEKHPVGACMAIGGSLLGLMTIVVGYLL